MIGLRYKLRAGGTRRFWAVLFPITICCRKSKSYKLKCPDTLTPSGVINEKDKKEVSDNRNDKCT